MNRERTKGFWRDERGMGTIEMVLIIVVLIGLVLAFRTLITGVVNNAFSAITNDANTIIGTPIGSGS